MPRGRRVQQRVAIEAEARHHARRFEAMIASSVVMPGRLQAPSTVGRLIDLYLASLGSRSTRYAERQEYLLRMWVRPVLGDRPLLAVRPRVVGDHRDQPRHALRVDAGDCRFEGGPVKSDSEVTHPTSIERPDLIRPVLQRHLHTEEPDVHEVPVRPAHLTPEDALVEPGGFVQIADQDGQVQDRVDPSTVPKPPFSRRSSWRR